MPVPSEDENPSTWDGDLRDAIGEAIGRADGVALTKMGAKALEELKG